MDKKKRLLGYLCVLVIATISIASGITMHAVLAGDDEADPVIPHQNKRFTAESDSGYIRMSGGNWPTITVLDTKTGSRYLIIFMATGTPTIKIEEE